MKLLHGACHTPFMKPAVRPLALLCPGIFLYEKLFYDTEMTPAVDPKQGKLSPAGRNPRRNTPKSTLVIENSMFRHVFLLPALRGFL